jgi:hypothetical protein
MRKLLLFFAVFLCSAGIASAQSEKRAKSPKKIVRLTPAAKATAPTPAAAPSGQARVQPAAKTPEAAQSLFQSKPVEEKKQKN